MQPVPDEQWFVLQFFDFTAIAFSGNHPGILNFDRSEDCDQFRPCKTK